MKINSLIGLNVISQCVACYLAKEPPKGRNARKIERINKNKSEKRKKEQSKERLKITQIVLKAIAL